MTVVIEELVDGIKTFATDQYCGISDVESMTEDLTLSFALETREKGGVFLLENNETVQGTKSFYCSR